MRVLLFLVCFLSGSSSLFAQTGQSLKGVYKRYWHQPKGKHIVQTLSLSGASAGDYTLAEEGGDTPDFSSGIWTRSKIWAHRRDSLDVVVLDPENKYETRYYVIDRTGCLTPVHANGDQIKRANSFAPVRTK